MNRNLYYDLVKWITRREVRQDAEDWTRNILLTTGRQFGVQESILYRKKSGRSIPVIIQGQEQQIIELAHDHPLSGHMGQDNTYFRLKEEAWWPGMQEDINNYVKSCDTCQKRIKKKQVSEASSATIVTEPFAHIGIDVMGPLPVTRNGKRYIILAVDFFTKYLEGIAVDEADAQTVAKFIHSDIICQYGVPKELTSDRGTEFVNNLIEELSRTYYIKHIKTTAYHPQGNGQTERMNQTIKNVLAKLIKTEDQWDHYLDSALFAVQTIRSKSTEFSSFELVYEQKPRREFHHSKEDQGSYEEKVWTYISRDLSRLHLIRSKATKFIEKAQERQRATQNKKITAEPLKIGDQVLIYHHIVEASWSAKLQPKWEGPYYVQDIKGTSIFLRKMSGIILTSPIHRNHIKKYYPRT
jgi:transposase InsO family protein